MSQYSIYELLDKVRPKLRLYVGIDSLSRLELFVQGYCFAHWERGLTDASEPPFSDFHFWARARLGQAPLSVGWATSILEVCGGDEAKAVDRFFTMLDEYRTGLFPGLVEKWQAEWEARRDAE